MEYYVFSSNIISLPLAFVRSGYVYPPDGAVYHALVLTPYGLVRAWLYLLLAAYRLGVYPTVVGPSNNSYRYHGFPLRC